MVEIVGYPISDEFLVAIISLASGFIATYLGAVLKFRKDLEHEYDKNLREIRIEAYKDLWKRLQPFARHSPPITPITYQTIKEVFASIRQWYFEIGGIFLSEITRPSYYGLMNEIQKSLDVHRDHKNEEPFPDGDLVNIKKKSSHLRKNLTDDIGSRMTRKVGGERDRD